MSGAFPRGFASDNFAGVHPRILARILEVNEGHAMAYGEDPVTARAREAFDRLFGRKVDTHFVFNGTAANVLGLMAFAKPHSPPGRELLLALGRRGRGPLDVRFRLQPRGRGRLHRPDPVPVPPPLARTGPVPWITNESRGVSHEGKGIIVDASGSATRGEQPPPAVRRVPT
jgi:hypothetical protein